MSILLSYSRYEFIKGEVVALFEKYRITKVPINGFELASKMNIKLIPFSSLDKQKLHYAKMLSEDGFYVEENSGTNLIFYNDFSCSKTRINMTILHEIGHCVLDHTGNSLYEEAEAKFFAKYASAPPPLVNRFHPNTSSDIAFYFGLSSAAAINSFNYYNKWLLFGSKRLKDYEIRLLSLFQ